jgi:alpha-D-xyloside xylohydrolase
LLYIHHPKRPLFLEFSDDAGIWDQDDDVIGGAFMFGPDYLVSPVTAFNATAWRVYLPVLPSPGARWAHHYTKAKYDGGQVVNVDVSDLDTFPLFKRTDAQVVV